MKYIKFSTGDRIAIGTFNYCSLKGKGRAYIFTNRYESYRIAVDETSEEIDALINLSLTSKEAVLSTAMLNKKVNLKFTLGTY